MAAKSSEQAAIVQPAAAADFTPEGGDRAVAAPVMARTALQGDSMVDRESTLKTAVVSDSSPSLSPVQITSDTFSSKKSLQQLTDAGVIVDNVRPNADINDKTKVEPRPIASFDKPSIEVGFADTLAQQGKNPDLVVRANGAIEMLNDPEKFSNGKITIAMERTPGSLNPTEAQQKSVTELYKYLDTRLKEQNPALAKDGVNLDNPQGLVPDKAASDARGNRTAPANVPDGADQSAVQSGNRFSGNRGAGRLSGGEVNDMFPGRDFKSRNGVVDAVEITKDTISSLNGSRGNHEFVGYRRGRGHAVGAYGMTADQFSNWLENVDIADLEEKERKGLVPPGTAARMKKMKEQLAKGETPDVLKKMKDTEQGKLTDADQKEILGTFGKEVQELAATDLINKYSTEMQKANPGKELDFGQIALAMHIGRVPTAEDLADQNNVSYMSAARNKFEIARANTANNGNGVEWNGDANSIVTASRNAHGDVKWGRAAAVVQNGRLGCAISVSEVLIDAGYNVKRNAGANALAQDLQRQGGQRISISEARPGDVVYGGRIGANGGGTAHIGIIESTNNGIRVGANSSSRGVWVSDQRLESAFSRYVKNTPGYELYAIRLPSKNA